MEKIMSVIDQIHQHRSIRKYKPDPVPEDLLMEILNAGIRTSSSGNMQSYSILVSRDQQIREKLLIPHLNQHMVIEAPVLLTFCADLHRMRYWLRVSQAPDNFDNFLGFLIGAIDAILVSQTVALAAESKGLGICYLGSTLANADQISEILELPKNVVPVVGFTLGHPAENPGLRDRLPADGLIHFEKYPQHNDQDILRIYQDRETQGWNRYMKSEWLRDQVKEMRVKNLAQLYTKVKYTQKNHQEIASRLLVYLDDQDFMNNSSV
jgi:nitroreductase